MYVCIDSTHCSKIITAEGCSSAIANSCVALYVCVYPGKVSYPSPPPARSSPTLRCPTTTVRKYVKTEGTQVSRHAIWLYRKSRVCEYD